MTLGLSTPTPTYVQYLSSPALLIPSTKPVLAAKGLDESLVGRCTAGMGLGRKGREQTQSGQINWGSAVELLPLNLECPFTQE